MKYLILKKSSCLLFYVDRNKTKDYWWSYLIKYAMLYTSRDEAQKKADSLKYGIFRVITENEAQSLRLKTDARHERKIDEIRNKIDYEHNYDPGDSEYWDNSDNGTPA